MIRGALDGIDEVRIGKILAVVIREQHEHGVLCVAVRLQPLAQPADERIRFHRLRHGAGVLLLLRLGRIRHGAVVDHGTGALEVRLRNVLLLGRIRPVAGIRDEEAEKRLVRDDLVIAAQELRIEHIVVHAQIGIVIVGFVAEVQMDLPAVINAGGGSVIGLGAVARITKQVRQRIRQRMLGVIRIAHMILRRDEAGVRRKLRVERAGREEHGRIIIGEIQALPLHLPEVWHIFRRHEPVVGRLHHDQDQVLARERAGHGRVGRLLRVGRIIVVQLRDARIRRRGLRPERHGCAAHGILIQAGQHQTAVGVAKLRVNVLDRVVASGVIPGEILVVVLVVAPVQLRAVHDQNARRTHDRQYGGHDPAAAAGALLRREDHGAEHQRQTHRKADPLPRLEPEIGRAEKARAVAGIREVGKRKARTRQLIKHAVRNTQQRKRHERDQQEDPPARPRQQRRDRGHSTRPQQRKHQRLPRPERHIAHIAVKQTQREIQQIIRQKRQQQTQPQRVRAQPPRALDRRKNGRHEKHPFRKSKKHPLKCYKNICYYSSFPSPRQFQH